MEFSAWQAGVLSGLAFGLIAVLCALSLRLLPAPAMAVSRGVLLATLLAAVPLTPPPLVLLARAGVVRISGGGHAASEFYMPYFALCVVFVVIAMLVSKPRAEAA